MFHSSTYNVVRESCFEVLSASVESINILLLNQMQSISAMPNVKCSPIVSTFTPHMRTSTSLSGLSHVYSAHAYIDVSLGIITCLLRTCVHRRLSRDYHMFRVYIRVVFYSNLQCSIFIQSFKWGPVNAYLFWKQNRCFSSYILVITKGYRKKYEKTHS